MVNWASRLDTFRRPSYTAYLVIRTVGAVTVRGSRRSPQTVETDRYRISWRARWTGELVWENEKRRHNRGSKWQWRRERCLISDRLGRDRVLWARYNHSIGTVSTEINPTATTVSIRLHNQHCYVPYHLKLFKN